MAHGSEVEKLERRWMENPMGVSFAPLAEAYRRAGDQPRALEVLAIGLANHPAYVPALIVQARCHLDVRADGAAEESFLAVLATDGHNLIALKGLADICERTERPDQARNHLDRLLEADPTHDDGRAQMERVTAVLAERERLRGQASEAVAPVVPEGSVPAAEDFAPVEPLGFEPTNAGGLDDPAALNELSPPGEPASATGAEPAPVEPDAEDATARTEPELLESIGWDGAGAEVVAGFETNEPDFEVEKDTAPFDGYEAGESAAPAGWSVLGSADAAVPFEEEQPAPWLEKFPDESVAGGSGDESAMEPQPDADTGAVEDGDAAVPESNPSPDLGASVWAPMGSAAWGQPGSVSAPPPEPPEPVAESAPDIGQVTPETAAWIGAVPSAESVEDAAPSGDEDSGDPTFTPGVDTEGATEPPDAVSAWEPAAEVPEDLPATASSSGTEDGGVADPTEWQDPAAEAVPTAEGADDAVTVVEGAESELPTDAEPEIEPALIMTETMARLFERQGHRTMALAIYAQLAEQDPGNAGLAAAVERLTTELSTGSATRGGSARGGVDPAAVDAIGGHGPSISAQGSGTGSDQPGPGLRLDAPATRASEELFSLSAVFGPVRPGPSVPPAVFAPGTEATGREPSFDEFFGDEGTDASGSGSTGPAGGEDLEQFTAWLRSLKR